MPISNNRQDFHQTEQVPLNDFLSELCEALREEIEEIERSGLSSILLKEGHRLYDASGGFKYQFKIDYLSNIPADTPCKLTIGNENHDVTVIAFDGNNLTIAAKEELPNAIAEAKLENGTTVLLELLIKRIESNSTKTNPAGQRMMHASDEEIQVVDSNDAIRFDDDLDVAQINAITSAVCNNMTFIWGPPGTGKTTVISHVISELLSRDRSVLLVSHTNSAVNGAIEKIDERYYKEYGDSEDEQYPILRLGVGGSELESRLQIETQIEVVSHDLKLEKERLEKEFDEIQKKATQLKKVITEFNWVENTQIDTIKAISNSISEVVLSIEAKKQQYASIHQEAQAQLASHPEYQEATDLKYFIKEAENEIVLLNERISSLYTEINDLTKKAQEAKDEIAKHVQYEELRRKEAKCFTENTLKDKIEECKKRVTTQEEEIASNKKLIEKAKQVIQQYESKNSIGKFFSSKKDYEQAIATVTGLTSKNEEAQRILNAAKLNRSEYETQLVELLSIKTRLVETNPSRTRLTWENEFKSCNAKIAQLKIELEDKKSKRAKAIDIKDKADIRLQEIQVVCKAIDSLLANLETTKADLDSLQKKNDVLETEFSKLIVDERRLCMDVYCIYDGFKPCDIEGLETALENAKIDIVGKDKNDIQIEIKDLEGKQESIITEQREIDKKIAEISMQVIKQAKVIGTTLAKSYLSDEIQNRTFDTIILDEASMAAIPALWCAAQVAEKNIVIVGDFLQLPPIVMAKTDMAKKWLGRDIFSVSGAQELFKSENVEKRPRNHIMLNLQFRMDEEIADIVNLYYSEYCPLRSSINSDKKKEERKDFYKWYNLGFEQDLYSFIRKENNIESCIHLFDTKSLNAWVTSVPTGKNSNSRMNVFSAVLSVELAFKLLERKIKGFVEPEQAPLVLIVAPYKPHIKWIEQLIQDKYRAFGLPDNSNLIHAGTIHCFQGKEAPIVIFDFVIDEPHHYAGIFKNKEEINIENRKLFNVAVSRAKYKLFFVGNFDYCVKKAKTNALGSLLKYLIKKYPIIDSKMHFPQMTYTKPSSIVGKNNYTSEKCLGSVFISKLQTEIQYAKNRIIIYSPFLAKNAIASLLPYFVDAINRNCEVVIITKSIDEFKEHDRQQRLECEAILLKNNLQIVHKKKMHEKFAFIDDEIVWTGSLNILSFNRNTQEVMSRCFSKTNAQEWFELLDIQHVLDALHSKEELKCPVCGQEVMMAESKDYGYYWLCSNSQSCGWNRNPRSQYPHDGKLVCPDCGGNYEFAMKGNQPIWRCKNKSSHYINIRKSDLKLTKMWINVPNEKIETARTYFHHFNNNNGQLSLF